MMYSTPKFPGLNKKNTFKLSHLLAQKNGEKKTPINSIPPPE